MEVARDPNTHTYLDGSKQRPTSLYRRLYLYQLRALFLKNVRLQSTQIPSNICHTITPLFVLVLLQIMLARVKTIARSNESEFMSQQLFPMIHNMPLNILKNSSIYPLSTSSCVKVAWEDHSVVRVRYLRR